MAKKTDVLKINSADNVAVALRDLKKDQIVSVAEAEYKILEDIKFGHKIALQAIKQNELVVKYGFPIGRATKDIGAGEWVHSHNLTTNLAGTESYIYTPKLAQQQSQTSMQTFAGYLRNDGKVGIRNEVWIIPTVGCCNSVVAELCHRARERFQTSNVDAIVHFSHPYGCSQLGGDLLNTQKILAGLINNPNAGAVLVVGLGCETNNIPVFKKLMGSYNPERVKFFNLQEAEDELATGLELLTDLIAYAETAERTQQPITKLVVGLKCGGSDAFSGITANPLVGQIADWLTGAGGSVILTEVPEMFGAETILMNRAKNRSIFNRIVQLINDFKNYFLRHGQVVYENPSPGNRAGGITTLEEKSLGCTQKAGTAPVTAVLEYGELITEAGLNLLNGPGNDIVAATALAASGAQLILFTTGRGTPLGAPVPTIKIASNSRLATSKSNWIDFNAGQLLEGRTILELATEFAAYIMDIASGKTLTKNEIHNYRQIAIFKDGVTL